jgi:putative ABC transport system permease protein
MFSITVKNVFKNKMLYFCLAAGFILSIAIVCAVPTYADSVLNNYINSIFVQAENKVPEENKKYIYPSSASLSLSFGSNAQYDSFSQRYAAYKSMFFSEARKIPVPILAEKVFLTYDSIRYTYTKDNKSYDSINNGLLSIADFNNHINIIKGRLPEGTSPQENTVEVMVDKRTFDNFNLELEKTYELLHVSKEAAPKMKVVGIFDIKDMKESYWFDKDTNFYCKFIGEEEDLVSLFKNNNDLGRFLNGVNLEVIYDYSKITNKNARAVYEMGKATEDSFIKRTGSDINYEISVNLKTYAVSENLYSTVIWIFLIPVLLVVMYYIWMISELIVDSDKEQIAVLKSRGASQLQILKQYLYDGLLLSSAGLIAGPALALAICKAISYSDGFLIFSSLQGIKISVNSKAYLYALVTVIILLVTLLTSVFFASQKSIIEVKQNKNRYFKLLFNSKYLDFILLAVALYGYYNYSINKNVPVLAGIIAGAAPLDPLLYLVSTIFIVGVGMFMLRIYRYAVRFLFKVVLDLEIQFYTELKEVFFLEE